MDGNGRWARAQGLRRNLGHERGGHQVRDILRAAFHLGIRQLTLYAFSTENWKRPKPEVAFLMNLLVRFLRSETEPLNKDNVRFLTLGDLARFPQRVQDEIARSKEVLRHNTGIVLCLALNYGARREIVEAAKSFTRRCLQDPERVDRLDEEGFNEYLETAGMPELDMLIRTAGEYRVSNFLLWQLSYAELYFESVFWPDFTPEHLRAAVENFRERDRRYGGLNPIRKKA